MFIKGITALRRSQLYEIEYQFDGERRKIHMLYPKGATIGPWNMAEALLVNFHQDQGSVVLSLSCRGVTLEPAPEGA